MQISKYLLNLIKNNKFKAVVFIISIALLGSIIIYISSAEDIHYSTDPNNVVVQYVLPDTSDMVNRSSLSSPNYAPFTLYGNGLLICGHSFSNQYTVNTRQESFENNQQLPTSTTLSTTQINLLLQQITSTGYMNLDKEYFHRPIIENQEVLRVSLINDEHYVLYYRDVPAPTSYISTLNILKSYCQNVDTPYNSSNTTLKVLAGVDTINNDVSNLSSAPLSQNSTVVNSFNLAINERSRAKMIPSSVNTTASTPGEYNQQLDSQTSKNIISQLNNKSNGVIERDGIKFEVGISPTPPHINNPLKINFNEIRSKNKNNGLVSRIKNAIIPKAYAAGDIPVRIVLLLASDGGNTDTLAEAQSLGQSYHDWYCVQVNACYNYQGVSVMTGSHTKSYYMTCHAPDTCTPSNTTVSSPMSAVIDNVSEVDQGTIFRSDVDTILVTGWSTGDQNYCGIGFVNNTLGIVDYHEPTYTSGASSFCQPGHDIAHETGHTFGLHHSGSNTLMDGPPYAQYSSFCDIANAYEPTCTLDSTQAAYLATDYTYFVPVIHPTISISTPANNSTLNGYTLIQSSASEVGGSISNVQYKLNGKNLGNPITSSPYTYGWFTNTYNNGTYSITAVATDPKGVTTTSSPISVYVNNPSISITSPATGSNIAGINAFTVTAAPSDGRYNTITKVQFYDSRYTIGSPLTTYPYTFIWDTSSLSGQHSIHAVITDSTGLSATSNTVTVNINNNITVPTINITNPVANVVVNGKTVINASAVEPISMGTIKNLQFYLDGAKISSPITSAPYYFNWNGIYDLDNNPITIGFHNLTAVATDSTGKVFSSSPLQIYVYNTAQIPVVSISSPVNNAKVSGITPINVSASETGSRGINNVQLKLDGILLGNQLTSSPYIYNFDTTKVANGNHSIVALASDFAGNTTASKPITINAQNNIGDTTPPSKPSNLVASAVSNTQINLSWNASTDNVAVSGYNIYRGTSISNMTLLTSVTTTSFGDTNLNQNTQYYYYIVAVDTAGNKSLPSLTIYKATLNQSTTVTVQGTITDSATGLPIYNAYVNATGRVGSSASGYTNTSGQYILTNIAANDSYTYNYSASGYVSQSYSASYPVGTYIKNVSLGK